MTKRTGTKCAVGLMGLWVAVAGAEDRSVSIVSAALPAGTLDVSLRNEVKASVDRALDWLAANQREDGSWSDAKFPAISALALQAFIRGTHARREEVLRRGLAFLTSCVQEDGGIYRQVPGQKGGGLSNYNTAICMTALHATGDRAYAGIVQKARKFIAGAQHFGDDEYRGGFGYDRTSNRAYADLLNTYYAVRAMRLTQGVEDLRPAGEPRVDINWSETVKFVERMQNPPAAGTNDAGGFFYKPGESKAGAATNAQGVVVLRSFGSMTYAGLLALVYANVNRDDVRVRSAFDWSTRHWSLDENPGMGSEGLFFFYNVLAKCLDAYGQDAVPLPGGRFVNWKEALARKLVAHQKIDPKTGQGYWQNANNRFWEADAILVTAYSLLALEEVL